MAFTAITTAEIGEGKPVRNETMTKVKDNLNDHETRIDALEAGSAIAYPPIQLSVYGKYSYKGAVDGVLKYIPNFNITIIGVRLILDVAGTSGTTEIDLKVSHLGGAYTSIFTTKPSLAYSAGNDAVSTNQVLDPAQVSVSAGDIIRLDMTQVQALGQSFFVRIDYVKS